MGQNALVRLATSARQWLSRWAAETPVQVGIAAASWSVSGSYARSLLPRRPIQQAVATGAVAAAHYQLATTAWALLQATAAWPGQRPGLRANLVTGVIGVSGGLALEAVAGPRAATSMPAAVAATAGRMTAFAGLAGAAAAAWDDVLHEQIGLRRGLDTTLAPSVVTGMGVVAASVIGSHQRARRYGLVAPDRQALTVSGPRAALRTAAIALGAGAGLATLTPAEQAAARAVERVIDKAIGRRTGALGALAAHGLILGTMAVAGTVALGRVTAQAQRRDDIIEPAYPAPPTSVHVSAGPASAMPFDSLGKEGRRFVLMQLGAADIERVMGAPAIDPVRVIGGYESADSVSDRARRTLEDMEACGAFDRGLIVVGVPTGVGYFNYSLAEAIEYLARGDSAIVVPQYALVPSALAITRTNEGKELTRLVLAGIRERLATMPPELRPRVVLAGESLGANIALDLAMREDHLSLAVLDDLGISGGLYLGVPFRSLAWRAWLTGHVDPDERLLVVHEPAEAKPLAEGSMRHLAVIHHDDPTSKYGYAMVVQPPWWMGPPSTRPPLVPREVKFRPITTFTLATVDLLNGMQSRPGTFVRVGHDYRIDVRLGVQRAYGLDCTDEQAQAIELELRRREQQWATRRMVARKLGRARESIERQLAAWGQPVMADLDPAAVEELSALERLTRISGTSS